ncbi:hypothetical protein SAMN04488030_0423 [Aliiroseovarius halocynthiae]|uniref:Glycosyl transferase n=1 Tax=Aliiroseovarius halocynthiae TaxID=985055 RepID=A0A545STX8_9RHOB|nr:hypothetical protein [Aliiroseovarius halocynthiae]TQV68417.1 hypothetical protein FIL88_02160 [Aliiroseovarius halocynthiae]SMR70810.1 hypothetical protein SAMN04488030_0423 [Aliiroseovarius halocynthiae]
MADSINGIPKRMGHIWIGPKPAPTHWMSSWQELHPDWEYTLYGNDILETFNFRAKHLIDYYIKVGEYAGAADLIRYEVLHAFGGYIAGADSICLHPIDELFQGPHAHTIYENEFVRGKLVSPIQACEPGNPFLDTLIDRLSKLSIDQLKSAWATTGNLFLARAIRELSPPITIWPSHTMIPVHFTGVTYEGNEKVYAIQLFGTTHGSYGKDQKTPSKGVPILEKIRMQLNRQKFRKQRRKLEKVDYFERAQRWIADARPSTTQAADDLPDPRSPKQT